MDVTGDILLLCSRQCVPETADSPLSPKPKSVSCITVLKNVSVERSRKTTNQCQIRSCLYFKIQPQTLDFSIFALSA